MFFDKAAYREGVCDAIMDRPSNAHKDSLKGFIEKSSYLAGYLHGQSLMNRGTAC